MPHSSSTLALQLISLVSSSSAAIGIRGVSISFSNKTATSSSCFRLHDSYTFGMTGECQCEQGEYYSAYLCYSCSSSCLDCYGSGANQCYSCAAGYSFDGTNCVQCYSSCQTCSGTGQNQCVTCKSSYWKQRNGTCTSSCNLPTTYRQVVDTYQSCITQCADYEFMLSNGTCINSGSCPSPLVLQVIDDNYLCVEPCAAGYFYYQNGSCISSCNLPWIQSTQNDVNICSEPCQTGEYFYDVNNTCLPSCPAPLISSAYDGISYCQQPCADPANFLFPNNSCDPSCPSLWIQSTLNQVNLCNQPCPAGGIHYWNGTCISTCPGPFLQSLINEIDSCDKPCPNNADFYYPNNNTCLSTCTSPLIQSIWSDINFCSLPCNPTSDFLFPNGSCYSTCPTPMKPSNLNNYNECLNPCSDPNDFYYPSDQSCQPHCQSPNITDDHSQSYKICSLGPDPAPITPSESLNMVDTISSTIDTTGTVATAGVIASSFASSGSPNAITLISLIKMLEYIRYMDINYPTKLQYMLHHQSESFLSNIFQGLLPEKIRQKFPQYSLPGGFADYDDLDSSFILNYWNALLIMVMTMLILLLSTLLADRLAKNVKFLTVIFGKIRDLIKWNLFLMILCSNIDGVGVFSSLELRNTRFNSALSALGTLTCISINILILFLLIKIPLITYSLQKSKYKIFPSFKTSSTGLSQSTSLKPYSPEEKYQNCSVLFNAFQNTSFLKQSCMFFILLRVYLFNIIIGYLFQHPLAQAFLITFLSLFMLIYLSISKPYLSKLELFKMITYESFLLAINISILILAILDHKKIEASSLRIRLGDIVIMANMVFSLLAVLFMVVEALLKMIQALKNRKNIQAKGIKYWLIILKSIIQPEEMEDHHLDKPSSPGRQKQTPNLQLFDQNGSLQIQDLDSQTLSPKKIINRSPLHYELYSTFSPQNNNSVAMNSTFGELIAGTPKMVHPVMRGRNSLLLTNIDSLRRNTSKFFLEDNGTGHKESSTENLETPKISPESSDSLSPEAKNFKEERNKLIRSNFSRFSFAENDYIKRERRPTLMNRSGRLSLLAAEPSLESIENTPRNTRKIAYSPKQPALISLFKPPNKEETQ